ncbi:MAG: hypothetical protein M3R50_06035, partial [Bacteroidota bacterium]|nr:hypothetical protein [Bacteroidota bacterium]
GTSCSKKDDSGKQPSKPENYLTTSTGSTWSYHQIDSSVLAPINSDYTISSTSKDSSINGRSYHVYNNSAGGNQYLNLSGNDYYQYDSLPAGFGAGVFERLYLKDNANVGTSWTQTQNVTVSVSPIPIPVTLTFKIVEKGISRIINNVTYTDVIHVSAAISSSIIPSASLISSLDSYYAKKYGMIESSTIINFNYSGRIEYLNISTKLMNSSLK